MQEEKKRDISTIVSIIGIAVVVVIIIVVVVMLFNMLRVPDPEVVRVWSSSGWEGLNYVFYVHAIIRNEGEPGYVVVYAEIMKPGGYEKQYREIYMDHGEEVEVTFRFDIGFIESLGTSYRVWAVPKR